MRPLRGSRALLTGAGGFVGANLARALAAEGAEVHGLVAPWTDTRRLSGADIELEQCDLGDDERLSSTIARLAPHFVFSLAATRVDDPVRLLATNVTAVCHLLGAAQACGARVVHLGSSTEYAPAEEPLSESDALAPVMPYGASKAAATHLCHALAVSRGTDVVVLRPFMVYGPWDRAERFVPRAIEAAVTGTELPLTPPGFRRDWVFVEDVVEACLRAAVTDGLAGEALNVGTGQESTPEEIAALVAEITGRPLRTRVGAEPPRAWDRERWVADLAKLERTFEWRPRTDLREGLRRTHEWFVAQSQPAGAR